MPIIRTYYKVHRAFPDPDYFYMENIAGQAVPFGIFKFGTPASTDLSYSFDKVTWTDIHDGGTITSVPNGAKVYFRSSTGFNLGNNGFYYIKASDSGSSQGYDFNVGGHIATLFDYTNVESTTAIPDYGCYCMFGTSNNGNGLVHADIDFFGIKTLGNHSLERMFFSSKKMVTVPDLSGVETVGDSSCTEMFYNCTSLTVPADLSGMSTVQTSSVFTYMYYGCSSLTEAIAPNISSWNTNVFNNWLNNTAATGVVRKPAGLTIPTDSTSGVPTGWTTENY